MTWVGRAPQKVHFCRLETLKKQILKLLPQKGEQRLYFTQLFVLSSNFELKIINFDLAVPIRGETGAWIGVYCSPKPGFSHQNCSMLSIFEYILVDLNKSLLLLIAAHCTVTILKKMSSENTKISAILQFDTYINSNFNIN